MIKKVKKPQKATIRRGVDAVKLVEDLENFKEKDRKCKTKIL